MSFVCQRNNFDDYVEGIRMDHKKKQILHSALKYFSEKGYYATSVQEIASDCGISKGSLYKYFQSKEELFVEVIEFFQNTMFEKATEIKYSDHLNNKEKLEHKILVQIDDFLDKKDFIMLQFKELPIKNNEELAPLLRRTKLRMMNWHRQSLAEAYGEKIEKHIWDSVIIFQGILKEYIMLMVNENMHIPLKRLVRSIVKRMDAVVESFQDGEMPLLSESMMDEYTLLTDEGQTSDEELLSRIIEDLNSYIKGIKVNENYKKELLSTIKLLKEELNKKEPKMFLIHALLSYLEKESEMKGYVYHIEKLLKK